MAARLPARSRTDVFLNNLGLREEVMGGIRNSGRNENWRALWNFVQNVSLY
jgi:hypothetical protein